MITSRRRQVLPGLLILLASLALGSVVVMATVPDRGTGPDGLSRAAVRRMVLESRLRVPGQMASARNTLIECEIERMSGSERDSDATRYSTLLSVVPEGTYVQKGDVLCEIDASGFIELARRQQIALDEARAEENKSRLDLEAAEVALREYRDGLRVQQEIEMDVQIALARATLERMNDRMQWSKRMQDLGYISVSQFAEEEISQLRGRIELDQAEMALVSYQSHTVPKMIASIQSQIDQARSTLLFWEQKRRLDAQTMDLYERQVKTCTIRAPHEGYVIYCVDDDDPPIAPGIVVRRHMDLFHLPDLSQLEVHAEVNQSMVARIKEGMSALVRLDARPGLVFEGRVVQIAAMPDQEDDRARLSGVSNYIVRVRIEADEELLPGMSADVEILTDSQPEALVIPAEALAIEGGRSFCYVDAPAGPERRLVSTAPGTIDLLRVIEGLSEGEVVILNPEDVNPK